MSATQFNELHTAIYELSKLNTKQHEQSTEQQQQRHDELMRRLFGPDAGSLQSQITANKTETAAINERAFGDNPTSLKSRQTETEKLLQFSKFAWAALCMIVGAAITFFAIKFQTVAGWLGYSPKPNDLHNIPPMIKPASHAYAFLAPVYHKKLYACCARLSAGLGKLSLAARTIVCRSWPGMVSAARKIFE